VEVVIEAGSVTTGNRQRDAHLRSGAFFDVAHHPEVTYRSVALTPVGDSVFRVAGHLTVRDLSRLLPLEFRSDGVTADTGGSVQLTAQAATVISRRDWGLTWSGGLAAGSVVVADGVEIQLVVGGRRVDDRAEPSEAPSWRKVRA
jgi:polyisoprenoid-binding protein YceI